MQKKLNTLTLSGLMIGPVLGSGIVLLPPLAIKILGPHAIIAWIITMILGGIFAYVFAKMSLLTTTNEGVSVIIAEKLGPFFGQLASNYLTMAVCFGPVAVLLTASDFIGQLFVRTSYTETLIAFLFLLVALIVLLMDITKIGKLSLVLSSLTAILLVGGGLFSLLTEPNVYIPTSLPKMGDLGYTLLLLFWAVIGWEVIGNYIEDVENPKRTIMRATKISLTAVIAIYLMSTFALQNRVASVASSSTEANMSMILEPLLGKYASLILGIIATGLCFCTFIMFVGAVARQVSERAHNGALPKFLAKKEGEASPKIVLLILATIYSIHITLTHFGWITLEIIVGIANTFFIGNALLGLFASFQCIKGGLIKLCVGILTGILCLLLLYSPLAAWILLIIVTGGSVGMHLKSKG